jgi:hypothetical protein
MMAWILCTKADVMSIHPITEAEIKDEWSDMVEGLIRQHMGQPFLGTSSAIVDEWHNGDGSNFLKPYKLPILSVTSLSINDLPIALSDCVSFDSYIALQSQTFPEGVLNVRISYTSGTLEVPETVRLAATTMIVAIINYRRRAGADSSIKWGSADQKAGEDTPNAQIGLTSHLVRIMKQILRRPTLRAR